MRRGRCHANVGTTLRLQDKKAMSDEQRQREAEVFGQEVSVGDLDAFSGGYMGYYEADLNYCVKQHKRQIYGGKIYSSKSSSGERRHHADGVAWP